MSRANVIQTNFTSGELSPLMYGRVDVTKYFNGARLLQNFIVRPQGGIKRRPGTKFVGSPKYSDRICVLKEFVFSETQAYILEFGDLYMRIYKDHALVTSGGPAVEVVTPWAYTDVLQLKFTQSADTLYVVHPNYAPRKITRTSHTAWTITTMALTDGPYLDPVDSGVAIPGVGTVRVIVSAQSDTAHIYASSGTPFAGGAGDVGKYVEYKQGDYWRLFKITAAASTSHAVGDIQDGIVDANPYAALVYGGANIDSDVTGVFTTGDVGKFVRVTNGTWYTITSFTNSGKVAATALSPMITYTYPTTNLYVQQRAVTATLTSNQNIFVSGDVGRNVRLQFGINQRYGLITAYSSATVVTISLNLPVPLDARDGGKMYQNGRADAYRLGAFSSTTKYPGVVFFHEQRLGFARSDTQPQTIWMSKSGDYENFAPTDIESVVQDDSAITYTIVSQKANPIVWAESGPVLLVGTIGAEFQISASSLNEAMTAKNITVKEQTRFGSVSTDRAHRIGPALLFLQRGGKKVREMIYNFNIDAFESKDMTILSEHILRVESYSRCSHYQVNPVTVLWVAVQPINTINLNTYNQLLGMTYERDQEVVAWHRHVLGANASYPDCAVESLAVVPETDGSRDNLYMVVARHTGASTIVGYIERMEVDWDADNPAVTASDQYYVDCGLSYSGSPATTISGLSHLEGMAVAVLADGVSVGPKTVSGGAITLSVAASKVHVGFGYASTVQTMDFEGGSPAGSSQGKIKRVNRLAIRVRNSYPFKVGPTLARAVRVPSFTGAVSQDVVTTLDQAYGTDSGLVVSQDLPYALNIMAIMPALNTNE